MFKPFSLRCFDTTMVETGDTPPIVMPPYRFAETIHYEEDAEITTMAASGKLIVGTRDGVLSVLEAHKESSKTFKTAARFPGTIQQIIPGKNSMAVALKDFEKNFHNICFVDASGNILKIIETSADARVEGQPGKDFFGIFTPAKGSDLDLEQLYLFYLSEKGFHISTDTAIGPHAWGENGELITVRTSHTAEGLKSSSVIYTVEENGLKAHTAYAFGEEILDIAMLPKGSIVGITPKKIIFLQPDTSEHAVFLYKLMETLEQLEKDCLFKNVWAIRGGFVCTLEQEFQNDKDLTVKALPEFKKQHYASKTIQIKGKKLFTISGKNGRPNIWTPLNDPAISVMAYPDKLFVIKANQTRIDAKAIADLCGISLCTVDTENGDLYLSANNVIYRYSLGTWNT